jgi:hemerythrin HHE cation binding domain-containing protein
MFEKLLLPEKHAIAILIKDHDRVKELFDRFEKSDSSGEKEKIISAALLELKIHASIEEEMFYPAVRKQVGRDLMNEADEEHHVARVLIAELDRDGRSDHRHAKFTVLAESVRHHIKEEEGEMLPKAKGLEIDFEGLGERILARKRELHKNGIPPDAEHAMVASANGRGDSPAARARRSAVTASTRSRKSTKRVTRQAKTTSRRASGSRKSSQSR